MEKISVILPIYNVEKYICECIDSIVNQTYKNLEIILVDDGSPDSCPQICDEYAKKDNRIKVIHRENGGVSSARNRGIKEATGEYIAFVDPDDWLEVDMYEKLYKYISENSCEVVLCQYCKNGNKNLKEQFKFNSEVITQRILSREEIKNVFLKNFIAIDSDEIVMGSICRGVYKSEIIKDKVLFDEEMKIAEDLCFLLNILLNINNLFLTNEILYNYRENSESVLHTYNANTYKDGKRKIEFLEESFKKINKYSENICNFDFLKLQNIITSIGNKSHLKDEISIKEHINYAKYLINENNNIFLNKKLYSKLSVKYKVLFLILKNKLLYLFIVLYKLKLKITILKLKRRNYGEDKCNCASI